MPKRYSPFRLYLAAFSCCLAFYGNKEAHIPISKEEKQTSEIKMAEKLSFDGDNKSRERSYAYSWPLSGQLFYQP
mgnify:CR=1 FL=1